MIKLLPKNDNWVILVISVLISLTIVSFVIQYPYQIYAQNQTMFIMYRNPALGFSIQHPMDWPVVNEPFSNHSKVMFRPVNSGMPSFTVKTTKLTPYLDTASMTVKNETLDMLVQEYRTNISKPNPEGLEMKLIRQNDVIVGGNPGWKFEATISVGPHSETRAIGYLFYVLTIANGKLYSLEYNENPLKVPETLPIANQMVDSFRFIPEPTLGYTSLVEQVENPKTFTPEQQAAIDTKCEWFRAKNSILAPKDEDWALANC